MLLNAVICNCMREAAYRVLHEQPTVASIRTMSPETRSRLGMVRPERVAEVCSQVHACFANSERNEGIVPLLHTMALLTLHRFDRLPPHRQSLAAIAGNIAGALERLRTLDRRLEGITMGWHFGVDTNGQPYDPRTIRQAVHHISALRPIEPRTFAMGVALYVVGIELAKRGLPQTVPLLAYRILQPPPWASFLEAGGVHSALLWNIAALLGTFSPPGPATARFTVADCDSCSEAIVRMLTAIAEAPPPVAAVESISLLAQSSLKFDRIIAVAQTAIDGFLEVCHHLLHTGGKALVLIPSAHLERWWHEQLSDALRNDWVEAIVEWYPERQPLGGWTFVLLRTTAPLHRRRRFLFGRLGDPLSIERIEELADALERGTTEAGWLRWHPLPLSGSITFPLESLPAASATTLNDVLGRWNDRGFDAWFLTVGNNGSLRFDERITTAAMLRTAICSAQSLRTQEMRYYYAIFQWWHRIAPLLSVHGRMLWQTIENSLVEHLSSVPIISLPQARALAINWWYAVAPDIIGVENYGARVVVESILSGVERKMRTAGVKLWKELDEREEFVVAFCVPHLYDRVRTERQHHAQLRSDEVRQLDERIATLQGEIAMYRSRMAQLHTQAKAHDVPHDAPELLDSTLPLQNELSELLKKMVIAQSELKMLQQNRSRLAVGDTESWFSPVVARCTAQLLPALQSVRRAMTDERAWTVLLSLWEEQLHAIADVQWGQLVGMICADFEHHWTLLHSRQQNGLLTSCYAQAGG